MFKKRLLEILYYIISEHSVNTYYSLQGYDRNARRKERVERRLHQLEAPPPTTPPATDPANDITEFAKLYFNDHPRSPEGNRTFPNISY